MAVLLQPSSACSKVGLFEIFVLKQFLSCTPVDDEMDADFVHLT